MTTGNTVRPGGTECHLKDTYMEVYPVGNMKDLTITTRIPKEHLSYSRREVMGGPSPLLIRKSYFDAFVAPKIFGGKA